QREKKRTAFKLHRATSHWPLKTIVFGPARTFGNPRRLNFKDLLCKAPFEDPVLASLYGLSKKGEFEFDFVPQVAEPLLKFGEGAGLPRVGGGGQKRAREEDAEEEGSEEVLARLEGLLEPKDGHYF